jgi:hypothetical protein
MINNELLEQSLAELQSQMERHRKVLRTIVEERPEMAAEECVWADCRHRRRLCSVLLGTIAAIDETRKAFRSRQLEDLKKELVRTLQEEMEV